MADNRRLNRKKSMPGPLNILLVEDEPSIANVISKGLTEAGHTVSIAPDGNVGFPDGDRAQL